MKMDRLVTLVLLVSAILTIQHVKSNITFRIPSFNKLEAMASAMIGSEDEVDFCTEVEIPTDIRVLDPCKLSIYIDDAKLQKAMQWQMYEPMKVEIDRRFFVIPSRNLEDRLAPIKSIKVTALKI